MGLATPMAHHFPCSNTTVLHTNLYPQSTSLGLQSVDFALMFAVKCIKIAIQISGTTKRKVHPVIFFHVWSAGKNATAQQQRFLTAVNSHSLK